MDYDALRRIVNTYNTNELNISKAYTDGGVDGLWARFERAALNQINDGEATLSRYGIWANTLRDNIIEANNCLERDEREQATKLLVRAANCLSAFAELQSKVDLGDCDR